MAANALRSLSADPLRLLRIWRSKFAASNYLVIAPLIYGVWMVVDTVQRVQWTISKPQVSDFLVLRTAARLVATDPRHLYDLNAQSAVESGLGIAAGSVKPFANPPLAAWPAEALGGLPLGGATLVWMGISALLLILAGILFARLLPAEWPLHRRALAASAVLGFAAVENLGHGQWGAVELVAIACSLLLLRGGRTFLAGLVLSVLLVKFQFVWALPAVWVVTRRARPLLGFCCGAAVWAVSTVVLVGPGGLRYWPEALFAQGGQRGDGIGAVAGLAGGLTATAVAAGLLAVLSLWVIWRLRAVISRHPELGIALALTAGFIASPHAFRYDAVLLAPALLIWLRRDHPAGLLVAFALGLAVALPVPTVVPVLAVAAVAASVLIRESAGDASAPDQPDPAALTTVVS